MGGNSWGCVRGPDEVSRSSPWRSTERPSSVDSDIRGISSVEPLLSGSEDFSGKGSGGTIDENDALDGEIDILDCEPCVLLLNLECRGGFHEAVLSRFPNDSLFDFNIILCRAVRSRTFFSVNGKYSVKCVVMSSLGGLCPKKLRNFEGLFVL
jgi:hypothetical protein